MFSFVYFCAISNSLYLARDRSGEKPLYYTQYKDYLILVQKLNYIGFSFLFKTTLNYSAIADYLHLDYISLNKTLFYNIKKVLPGEYIKYHKKNLLIMYIGSLIKK